MTQKVKALKLLQYLQTCYKNVEAEYVNKLKSYFDSWDEYYHNKNFQDLMCDINKVAKGYDEPYCGMIDDLYTYFMK